MISLTWSRDFFWKYTLVCKLYTMLILILFYPSFNFKAGRKVDISCKKLRTREHFWETSRDHIHDVIYKCHFSGAILNVIVQLTSFR